MRSRRRQYIVDAAFQWKYAARFVSIALIGSTTVALVFKLLAEKKLQTLEWRIHITMQSITETLTPLFVYVNLFNLLFVAALLSITGVFMIKRVNGPVCRMIQSLETMKKGGMPRPISLRKNDAFKDVADKLNVMFQRVTTRFQWYRSEYAKVSNRIDVIVSEQEQGRIDLQNIHEALEQLAQMRRHLRNG